MSLKDFYNFIIKGPWITSGEDVQYWIKEDETTITLSFQGSASKSDWFHNFSFWVKPYKNQPVIWYAHSGFVALWKSVRDEVIDKIISLNKAKKIVVSGYSQGAALAILAYEDLVFIFKDSRDIKSIVFGSPRVFWFPPEKLKERIKNLTLYKNRGDIITNLPFWIMGFKHLGTVIKIGKFSLPWYTKHLCPEYRESLEDYEKMQS